MTREKSNDPVKAEKRARHLEAVLQLSRTIASSLDLDHTLEATCRAAVDLLAVQHSTLVMMDHDRNEGTVRADYPEIGVRNLIIQFDQPLKDTRLGMSTEPIFVSDVRAESELGIVQKHLLDHNIQSTLIVPVVIDEQILGYFSLDTIGHLRKYSNEEVELCRIFASQVAVAIKNAQLYEETKQWAEHLESLRRTTLAVTSRLERDELLKEIIAQAVGLLKAKKGGIFENRPEYGELIVIVGYYAGAVVRVGEGMAGRLAESNEWYKIVPDYDNWKGRAPVEVGKRPSGAVLEVKIMLYGQLIGDLFVEDDVGRKFTEKDAQLLKWFADQAAIAMYNAKLTREHQDNLTSLTRAVHSLSGHIDPGRVLQEIAELARTSLGGDSATLWPYYKRDDEFLIGDLATVGISGSDLQEFKNLPPPVGGISREALKEGWIGVEDLEEAPADFVKHTPRTQLLLRMGIKSFQGVALRVDNEDVGVMFVNYKRKRSFNKETRDQMKSLATNAALAVAIVSNARLVGQELVSLSAYFLTTLNRQEVLDHSVQVARELLKADRCSIVLPDSAQKLVVTAEDAATPEMTTGKLEVERGRQSQTGYTIDTRRPRRVSDYDLETEFTRSQFLIRKGFKSGMSVPMFSKNNIVGAMLVHSRDARNFTPAEEETLWEIANHTAIAIERCDEIARNTAYLNALHNASKAITEEAGKAIYENRFEQHNVLYEIAKQTFKCLVDSNGYKATLSTLQLFDPETKELSFESAYPDGMLPKLQARLGQRRPLMNVPNNKIGLTGHTALHGKPLLVPDVTTGDYSEYYYEFVDGTLSELTVPLLDQGEVLGVLNVESDHRNAFDKADLRELKSLADIAVIAIRNSNQFKQLKKTERLVAAGNAVAFMGMASSIWGHSIRGYANNIRELVRTLREDLTRSFVVPRKRSLIDDKLERIEDLTSQIIARPVVSPLGSDKGADNLSVNDILRERVRQLHQTAADNSLRIELDLLDSPTIVRCHPQWLRRALDILFDNAVEALMKVNPAKRLLKIGSKIVGNNVQISIADSGPGIPRELHEKILKEQVSQPSEGGRGIGLLMAQTIINAYSGDISFTSDTEGTTMQVSLPLVT